MSDTEDYQSEVRRLRAELEVLRGGRADDEGGESAGGRVKPLRSTEVARALLLRFAQASGDSNTVELTRNAKGDTQIRVTGRAENLDDASAEARRVYDALAMLYPLPAVTKADK